MSSAVANNAASTTPAGITPTPMPQYNGTLRQAPGSPAIYLVLNGLLCLVPNMETLANLFVSGVKPVQDPDLDEIQAGPPLTRGAVLAQAIGTAPCYLVTNGVKMWIINSDAFNAYQFNVKNIQFVQGVLIDFIPTGADVVGPSSPTS